MPDSIVCQRVTFFSYDIVRNSSPTTIEIYAAIKVSIFFQWTKLRHVAKTCDRHEQKDSNEVGLQIVLDISFILSTLISPLCQSLLGCGKGLSKVTFFGSV